MQFISTYRQKSYTVRLANIKIVETADGNIVVPQKSLRIKFSELPVPFETHLLVTRGAEGKALGILNTEDVAKDLNLPEEDINSFLMHHNDYGISMIAIGNDGKELVSEEVYFVPEGDTQWYCKLCKQHFKTKAGIAGHGETSNEHKENLENAQYSALARLKYAV